MVGTIAPLVKVDRRRWFESSVVFVSSTSASGALLGIVVGWVGQLVMGSVTPIWSHTLLAGTAAILALVEIGVLPIRLPSASRSVPQRWWLRYGPKTAALAYGAVLGLGITTAIPFASFYLLLAGMMVTGPVGGAVIGASYGFGRASAVPLSSALFLLNVEPVHLGRWILNRRPLAKALSGGGLLAFQSLLSY